MLLRVRTMLRVFAIRNLALQVRPKKLRLSQILSKALRLMLHGCFPSCIGLLTMPARVPLVRDFFLPSVIAFLLFSALCWV
jgi:hypothetical protein